MELLVPTREVGRKGRYLVIAGALVSERRSWPVTAV